MLHSVVYVTMRLAPVLALIVCVGLAVADATSTVLNIDPVTGCTILDAEDDIIYGSSQTISGLQANLTDGGNVENCIVCENSITITMPKQEAAHPMSTRPVFRGTNCKVDYGVNYFPNNKDHLCAAPNGVDGRRTNTEQCDDANSIPNDGCTGNVIDDDPATNRVGFHMTPAVAGDGYITVSEEVWDNNEALRSTVCDLEDSSASPQCPALGVPKEELLYHSIAKHGESAVDETRNVASIFEFIRVKNDNEEFKVQFLTINPSNQKTRARVISDITSTNLLAVVQCAQEADDDMSIPTWEQASTYSECSPQIKPTNSNPITQCKIANPELEIETVPYCGSNRLDSQKHRVYVFSKMSGNLFANVTLRFGKNAIGSVYNDFRYLNMLSFMPKLYADDVGDVSFELQGGTDKQEQATDQTFEFVSSQSVSLPDSINDGSYVRRVLFESFNALRYADATGHVNSKSGTVTDISSQLSGDVLYFSSLNDGIQESTSQYTVGAYENTVAQAGKMRVQVTSLVYACDQNEDFEKSAEESDIGIKAVVFDKNTINDELLMDLPSSYTERESFDLRLTWNTDGADTSPTRTWNSVRCCTDAVTGKNYPTFSSLNASLTVTSDNKCFNLTSTEYSTASEYTQRNQMLLDGLHVNVKPCDHASQNFILDCTVERIEDGPVSDLQAKGTPDTTKEAAPVIGEAVVDELSDINSWDAGGEFELVAGGAPVEFKICTYVSSTTLDSGCQNSEYVSLAQFKASGFEVDHSTKVGFDSSYLILGGYPQNSGNSVITFATNLTGNPVQHCNTYSLSASPKAATCESSFIDLRRDHEVRERDAAHPGYFQQGKIVVKEVACPFDLTGTSLFSMVEDTPFALKDEYTVQRQEDCGATEHVKQIKFTISGPTDVYNKFTLAEQSFTADGTLIFDASAVSSVLENNLNLFDSTGTITFKDGVVLAPTNDFNTINVSSITLNAEFTSESCDGDSNKTSSVSRSVRVQDIVDTCEKTALKSPLEGKRGRWMAQSVIATISNLDERRNFKLEITSNFAIEARIGLSGPEIDCQNGNDLIAEQTCTLYCTPDATEPAQNQDTSSYWTLVSGSTYECTSLKSLYIRPKYVDTDTNPATDPKTVPTLAGFHDCRDENGVVTTSFQGDDKIKYSMYCSYDSTGNYQSYDQTTYESPYFRFYLDLVFSSSIADSLSTTYLCDNKAVDSSTLAHRMYIAHTAIYGEVYIATGANDATVDPDRVWTANGEISETTYEIDGTDLNNGNTLVYLKRRAHALYHITENSLEIQPTVSSQNCRNNEGNLISISVEITTDGDPNQGYIWWSGPSEKPARYIRLITPPDEHIASDCTVEVMMSDITDSENPSPVFYPLYTTSVKLTFNIEANLGDVVVVDPTPGSTSESNFTVYFERQGGSDGVLETKFTLDFSGCTLDGADVSIFPSTLTWNDEENQTQTAVITKVNAQDCKVRIFRSNNGLASEEIASIWLSGGLGSFRIAPHPYETASYSLLRAIGDARGQKFLFKREDVEDDSWKAQFEIYSDQTGVLFDDSARLTLTWESDENDSNRTVFVKYANAPTSGNLEIKVTLKSYQDNDWEDQDTQTFTISIDNDVSTCSWASIESVSVSASSLAQPEVASLYSAYVDKYVVLYENAAAFNTLGQTFSDVVSLIVQRPAASVGAISFQFDLVTFDREQTGVLPLQKSHFEDLLGTVYHMADGETSKPVSLKIFNDVLNYGDRLGFLVIKFESMETHFREALGADSSAAAIAACDSEAAKNTALSSSIKDVVANYAGSQRRLLEQAAAVRPGNGAGNIRARDDDINEPLTQDRTSDAVTARFWSGASLNKWNSALEVEMTFKVPVYTADHANDRYYGSYAMIGSCPTNATTLFSQLPTCSTFVPLSPAPADTTAYVRMLSGQDATSNSTSSCSNAAWPCADRWVQPDTIGFSQPQTDMEGHSLGNSVNDLPVYPYKFATSLNDLKLCQSYDENGALQDAVTTTTSTGTTAYGFETCIVTYGQRFADVSDSDVVLHTAQQSVQLESSDEAVVTALMFELNEKIRVSVVPRQRQCTGCTANYGPQYDTCSQGHSVQLLLDATIDVPYDEFNKYKYTGVFDVENIVGATTGCHWDTTGPVYLDDSTYTVRQIERTENRNGQGEQLYQYIRTEFTLKSACMSAYDGTDVVSDIFQTCADSSKDAKDYDFLVQLGSCETLEQLKKCTESPGDNVCASNCIKTGNDKAPTLIQADVSFVERPPTFDMRESTAISLDTDLFKFGSSVPVKYELDHRFTSKDTVVMVVGPKDAESFDGPEFGLTCPDTHIAAYNPVSSLCTTNEAQAWTFTKPADGISSKDSRFDVCEAGGVCPECENYNFPLALAGQSVMFDGAQTVRICHNATHVKKSMDVYMLDFVHTYWFEFYEYDWRARPDDLNTPEVEGGCSETSTGAGNCRRACDGLSNPNQVEEGCGKYCEHFSAFGGGRWITPILTASAISKNGDIVPSLQDGIIANSLSDAKMCKHDNANASDISTFGSVDGWSQDDVCNGQDAKTPQHCGFSGLEGSTFSSTSKRISAGLSIFAGGLLPNTLYSLSAHW